MANTTNLVLPLMSAAQSQKHITHNDALLSLDAMVQLSVISTALTAPPGSPSEGDRYLIASGATGAWAGKDLNITYYTSGAWVFLVPREGWLCWDRVTDVLLVWSGSAWLSFAASAGAVTTTTLNNNTLQGSLTMLGIGGATPDSTNKLSVDADGTVFSYGGTGSFTFTINKDLTADDAMIALQKGFSTRALFGLLGDDDLTIKTSPDGSTFKTAVTVNKTTAAVSLVEHPKFSAYLNFGQNYTAGAWQDLLMNTSRHNDQADLVIASNIATFTAPHDGYYMFGLGATYETTGGTAPVKMQVGLSVAGAAPTGDTIGTAGDATVTDQKTQVQVTALLKLTAGQTVKPKIYFTTNNGRVLADENYFWGCQMA